MSQVIRLLLSAVLIACGVTLTMAELELLQLSDRFQAAVALVFVCLAPGHGWAWALGLHRPLVELALSLVLSLALSLLVAMALVAAGDFDIALISMLLVGIGLLGSCVWLLGPNFRRQEVVT